MSEAVDHVKVFQDSQNQWRFTAVASNGEPVATSEGYADKRDAVNEAGKLFPQAKMVEEDK